MGIHPRLYMLQKENINNKYNIIQKNGNFNINSGSDLMQKKK